MVKLPDKERRQDKRGRLIGAFATVAFHLLLCLFFIYTGMEHIEKQEEMGILLDFSEPLPQIEQTGAPKPIEVQAGNEPKALDADPNREIRLVQQSQAQEVATKPSEGKESSIGPDGDVEKPEPKKVEINQRALFTSANNKKKDTLAAQTAQRVSDALQSGHPQGNTRVGATEGEPSAQLAGRNVVGSLPFPAYNVNSEGKVVVKIMVDQYGKVTNAIPGVSGTTVQDKRLWESAKEAAYKAVFNISDSAPTLQEGTITYIFKLK
ncbi:MAG: hypothetical protein IKY70_07580 [Bacteroidales bacterium]|nr:hypothetical protein [Bacteroidales bacterium]